MIGLSISLFALSSYATTPPIHEQSRCLVKPNQEARNVNTNKVLGQDTNEGGYGTCYLVDNDYVIQLQGGRRFKVNKSAVTEVIPLNKLQTPNPLVERFNGLKNRIFGSKVEEPTQKPTSNEDFSYSGLVKIRTVRPLSPQEAAAKSTPTQPATSPVIEPASRPTTAVTQNETINEDLESKRINILESVGRVAVKSNPNLTSTFECPEGINPALCDKAKTINHSTPLTLTGREQEDRDNKINYVEASYEIENHDFVGWFDKKQTTLDPHQQQVRTQTAITSSEKKEWNQYNEIRGSVSSLSVEEAERNDGAEIKKTFRRLQGLDVGDGVSIRDVSETQSEQSQVSFPNSKAAGRKNLIRLHNNGKGLCGATNYTESGSTKSYAHPLTACLVSKLAETWQKEYCPNNGACRLEFGNISHHTNRFFGPHKSHTDGYCMDVRPIKKSGIGSLTYNSNNYDQEKTRQLIKLIKKLGGDSILFNDPKLRSEGLSGYWANHSNHVHFCFKPNDSTAQNQCKSYVPDEKICPSSNILFNHPTMQDMLRKL